MQPSSAEQPSVVLLHDRLTAGARVDSGDVLAEAEHVAEALGALGYRPAIEPVGLDLTTVERTLAQYAPLAVFNLVEGLDGRAELIHVVPALLEAEGMPVTGCPAAAQFMTSNKLAAKRQLTLAGIATPELCAPGVADAEPWIVKSVWEHASLGIDDSSVLTRAADVSQAIARRRAEHGGDWFAERFIPGRELNVALLAAAGGVRTLPVAEIRFESFPAGKPQIVGYAAKWYHESFEYLHTPRTFDIEPALVERARHAALGCWELFGLQGYARVDLRVDACGELWVLDVNANPCLSRDAGFAAALEHADIAFADAVSWLLQDALRRAQG